MARCKRISCPSNPFGPLTLPLAASLILILPLRTEAQSLAKSARGQTFSQEFDCPSTRPQTFVVPPSVTLLNVEADGGRGGTPDPSIGGSDSGAGGFGAAVTGLLPVTPGQALTIWAGCEGDARTGFGGGGTGGKRFNGSPDRAGVALGKGPGGKSGGA